ncbi:hypothetical protein Tco_0467821 [Tanacetum coccineum]
MGQSGVGNSYVQVVKGNNTSVVAESDHTPTLVLDDECLNTSDLSNSLMGRVKEFASLSNLKMVLHKEGFNNIKIQYMGEFWWLWNLNSEASKKLFMLMWQEVTGWAPAFLRISDEHASDDDVIEGEFKCSRHEVERSPKTCFEERSQYKVEGDKSEHSPQYPPGYTPKDGIETFCNNGENSKKECGEFSQGGHEEGVNDVFKDIGSNKGSKDDVAESVCSGHFKKSVNPRTGGSILNLMEELVKVGQTMGYNMDGCMNNMTEIIESQGVKEGFR